jgi:GNAT superfamily N-acetyltransferase
VLPEARGSGTGSALIDHVRSWASDQQCVRLVWLAHAANTPARHLYEKLAQSADFVQYEILLDPLAGVVPPGTTSI